MKNFSKNFIWALVILMVISAVYSIVAGQFSEQKEMTLSELVSKINTEEVGEITVADTTLQVKLKNGQEFHAQKEVETGITETLKNYGVDSQKLSAVNIKVETNGAMGFLVGGVLPILGPVILIAFLFGFTARKVQQGSMQTFTFGQSRARLINPANEKQRVTFNDVAGVKEAKEELKEEVDFLRNPQKFLAIGAQIPKGVLLLGAPGTGKTLLARAVAGEANVPFFYMSASEFVEMFVGIGASRVRDTFSLAKKSAPAIIFIDEIDAIGRQRGAGLGGGHDESEQTLNQILVELDGFEPNERIIVLAATNRPDILDTAL